MQRRITITCEDLAREIRKRDPQNPITGEMIRRNYCQKNKLDYWRPSIYGTFFIKPCGIKSFLITYQGYTPQEAAEAEANILANFNMALTA